MIKLKVDYINKNINNIVISQIDSEYLYLYSNKNDISCFVKNKYNKNLDSEKIQIPKIIREYLDIYIGNIINVTKIKEEYLFKLKFIDIILSSYESIILHENILSKKYTNTFIPNIYIDKIDNNYIELVTNTAGIITNDTKINFIEGNNVKIVD